MNKGIHATSFFGGNVLRDIETLYLTRYLGSKGCGIEPTDSIDTRLSCEDARPCIWNSVANWGNNAQPCNDYSSLGQDSFDMGRR
jgi:hypothetical protein